MLALKPEIVLPSHGLPIKGHDQIVKRLTRYRDAIQYVHDATVQGMNDGKDVFTLMREIKLPAELDVGETYGKVSWSVRGIYEGYVGWFDLQSGHDVFGLAQRGRRRPGRTGRRRRGRGRQSRARSLAAATPCADCDWPTRRWRAKPTQSRGARSQAAGARSLAKADAQRPGARLAGLRHSRRAEGCSMVRLGREKPPDEVMRRVLTCAAGFVDLAARP